MASEEVPREQQEIGLSVSDPSQLRPLKEWLRGQPDARIVQTTGVPAVGKQGALDALTVLAGSSGLVAVIRVLPEFIRSRRSNLRIEITAKDERYIVDAGNVEQVLPILEKLLRD